MCIKLYTIVRVAATLATGYGLSGGLLGPCGTFHNHVFVLPIWPNKINIYLSIYNMFMQNIMYIIHVYGYQSTTWEVFVMVFKDAVQAHSHFTYNVLL